MSQSKAEILKKVTDYLEEIGKTHPLPYFSMGPMVPNEDGSFTVTFKTYDRELADKLEELGTVMASAKRLPKG